jgi:hypothetical protein
MNNFRDEIAGRLAAFPRLSLGSAGLRRAAVAILLSPLDAAPASTPSHTVGYVLTRRALTLRRGAGNYALPGGAADEGEDAVAAALREKPRRSLAWCWSARQSSASSTTSSP